MTVFIIHGFEVVYVKPNAGARIGNYNVTAVDTLYILLVCALVKKRCKTVETVSLAGDRP